MLGQFCTLVMFSSYKRFSILLLVIWKNLQMIQGHLGTWVRSNMWSISYKTCKSCIKLHKLHALSEFHTVHIVDYAMCIFVWVPFCWTILLLSLKTYFSTIWSWSFFLPSSSSQRFSVPNLDAVLFIRIRARRVAKLKTVKMIKHQNGPKYDGWDRVAESAQPMITVTQLAKDKC